MDAEDMASWTRGGWTLFVCSCHKVTLYLTLLCSWKTNCDLCNCMISYLQKHFHLTQVWDKKGADSLAIRSGCGRSCLLHDHARQYVYAMMRPSKMLRQLIENKIKADTSAKLST